MKDFLTKSKSFTNPEYGCAPEEREISDYISHGVINLDKPSGPTSHEIDSWVKRILKFGKIQDTAELWIQKLQVFCL